jgi:hypothetical protein
MEQDKERLDSATPDLSGKGDPAWTRMFDCGILMAALSVW